jgi:hypothetical protein
MTPSRNAAKRIKMSAWSNVTNCFARRKIAKKKEVRPQPHVFMAATILANSFIATAPDYI